MVASKAVVIGVSAGGLTTLRRLFSHLKDDLTVPIIVVQHLHPTQNNAFIDLVSQGSRLPVIEAQDKSNILGGNIYISPPGYHLLIESNGTLSLSIDDKVNHCRPSIDAMFESAIDAFGKNLIGIILTGANHDGANGLRKIKDQGGITMVEDPATAEYSYMPLAALAATKADYTLKVEDLAEILNRLC